jgi:histidine triad (HIT) family protein
MDCIFCQIRDKKIPAKILYEDEDVLVFPDIRPVRPVHLLVIPKQHVSELIAVDNAMLLQKLLTVVQNMIAREGLKDKGYRVTLNGGGAQIVQHLHIHVMGPMKKTDTM